MNKKQGPSLILERLDRALCSVDWLDLFKGVLAQHLARTSGDHHVILLKCRYAEGGEHHRQSFFMLDAEFLHGDFRQLVDDH